ncbi:Protein Jade-3 [Holothuria leucospilota]|uniref:Protein Jade-3 n=1 Tax=Holothuria leucospilota TaxID=206669 RepID=A0A9Q1BJQ7_HOLLE|nr:Protein Jade-3 [Holothuria leucospilota]
MFHSSSSSQPAEVFRKDLISAMKLPDSHQLQPEEYWVIQDQWKQEWEKGVQVPVDDTAINEPQFFEVLMQDSGTFELPDKFIKCYSGSEEQMKQAEERQRQIEATCQYDLDEVDIQWLHIINREREDMGESPIDELTMEKIIEQCEIQCQKNIEHALQTEEGLGIEYDEDICCAVCRAPDSEEDNEMVFCDKCDICVHQACYGVVKIPEGSWMCRVCALGLQPECMLCGKKGGAMKSTRSGTKWAHVNCALWVPEVSIGDVERMEPITNIFQIPASRWALICNLCRERTGACIQCSVKTCKTAYHVTCAVEHNLEMEQQLDENKDVKFRSYCLKHTNLRKSPNSDGTVKPSPRKKSEEEKANARALRIQKVTEEFQKFVKMKEVAASLNFKDDLEVVDLIFEYWKLKRKSGFNKPLLSFPREDDKDKNSEEYNLHARMKMFVHLRQDLERVRNLCYMVQRREKLSRDMLRLRENLFKKQCEFFNGNISRMTEEEVDWAARAGEISARVPFPMSEDVILNKWLSIPSDGPKLMLDDEDDSASEEDSDLEMEAKKERDKKKREKAAARKKKEAEATARLKEKLAQVKGPVSSNTRGVKHRRVSSMDGKIIYEDEVRSRKGGTPNSYVSDASSVIKEEGESEKSDSVEPERENRLKGDSAEVKTSESESPERNNIDEKKTEKNKGNENRSQKSKTKNPVKGVKSENFKERPISKNKQENREDFKKHRKKDKVNSIHNHKLDMKSPPAKRKSIENKDKDSKHSINKKDRKNLKDPKQRNSLGRHKSPVLERSSEKNHIKQEEKLHFLGRGLEVKEEWTYWQTSEQRKLQSEKEVRHDEDKNAAEFLLQEVMDDKDLTPMTPFEDGNAKPVIDDFIERHTEDQSAADFLAKEIFDEKISNQDIKDKFTPLVGLLEKEQELIAAERLLNGLDDEKIVDWKCTDLLNSKSEKIIETSLDVEIRRESLEDKPEDLLPVENVKVTKSKDSKGVASSDAIKHSKGKVRTEKKESHHPERTQKDVLKKNHRKSDSHKEKKKSKTGKDHSVSSEGTSVTSHVSNKKESISGKDLAQSESARQNGRCEKLERDTIVEKKEELDKSEKANHVKMKKGKEKHQKEKRLEGGASREKVKEKVSENQEKDLKCPREECNKKMEKSSKKTSHSGHEKENKSQKGSVDKRRRESKDEVRHAKKDKHAKEKEAKSNMPKPTKHRREKAEKEKKAEKEAESGKEPKPSRLEGIEKTASEKTPRAVEKKKKERNSSKESLSPVTPLVLNDSSSVEKLERSEKQKHVKSKRDDVDRQSNRTKQIVTETRKTKEMPLLPVEKRRDSGQNPKLTKHNTCEQKNSLTKKDRKQSISKPADSQLNGEESFKEPRSNNDKRTKLTHKETNGNEGMPSLVSQVEDVPSDDCKLSIFDVQGIDDAYHEDKSVDTNNSASIFDWDPSEQLFEPERRRSSRRASSVSSERSSQADAESTDDSEGAVIRKSKRRKKESSAESVSLTDTVHKGAAKQMLELRRLSRRRGSLSSDRSSLADSTDDSEEVLSNTSLKSAQKTSTPLSVHSTKPAKSVEMPVRKESVEKSRNEMKKKKPSSSMTVSSGKFGKDATSKYDVGKRVVPDSRIVSRDNCTDQKITEDCQTAKEKDVSVEECKAVSSKHAPVSERRKSSSCKSAVAEVTKKYPPSQRISKNRRASLDRGEGHSQGATEENKKRDSHETFIDTFNGNVPASSVRLDKNAAKKRSVAKLRASSERVSSVKSRKEELEGKKYDEVSSECPNLVPQVSLEAPQQAQQLSNSQFIPQVPPELPQQTQSFGSSQLIPHLPPEVPQLTTPLGNSEFIPQGPPELSQQNQPLGSTQLIPQMPSELPLQTTPLSSSQLSPQVPLEVPQQTTLSSTQLSPQVPSERHQQIAPLGSSQLIPQIAPEVPQQTPPLGSSQLVPQLAAQVSQPQEASRVGSPQMIPQLTPEVSVERPMLDGSHFIPQLPGQAPHETPNVGSPKGIPQLTAEVSHGMPRVQSPQLIPQLAPQVPPEISHSPSLVPPGMFPMNDSWIGQKTSLEKMEDLLETSGIDSFTPQREQLAVQVTKAEELFNFPSQPLGEAKSTRATELFDVPHNSYAYKGVPSIPSSVVNRRSSSRLQASLSKNVEVPQGMIPKRGLQTSSELKPPMLDILSSDFSELPLELNAMTPSSDPRKTGNIQTLLTSVPGLSDKKETAFVGDIVRDSFEPLEKSIEMEPLSDLKADLLSSQPGPLSWRSQDDVTCPAKLPVNKDFNKGIRRRSVPVATPEKSEPMTVPRNLRRNSSVIADRQYQNQLNFPVHEMALFNHLRPTDGGVPGSPWEPPRMVNTQSVLDNYTMSEKMNVSGDKLFRMSNRHIQSRSDPPSSKQEGSWREILDNMPSDSGQFGWNPSDLPEFITPIAPPIVPPFSGIISNNVSFVPEPQKTEKSFPEDKAPAKEDVEMAKEKEVQQTSDKSSAPLNSENGVYFHKKLSLSLNQRRREERCKTRDSQDSLTQENPKLSHVDVLSSTDHSKVNICKSVTSSDTTDVSNDPKGKVDESVSPPGGKDNGKQGSGDSGGQGNELSDIPSSPASNSMKKDEKERGRFSRRLRERKKASDSETDVDVQQSKSKEKRKVDENRNLTDKPLEDAIDVEPTGTQADIPKDPLVTKKLSIGIEEKVLPKPSDPLAMAKKSSEITSVKDGKQESVHSLSSHPKRVSDKQVLSPRKEDSSSRSLGKRHLLTNEFNKHIRGSPMKPGRDGRKKISPPAKKRTSGRRSKRQKTARDGKEKSSEGDKSKGGVFDFTSDEDMDEPMPVKLSKSQSPRVLNSDGQHEATDVTSLVKQADVTAMPTLEQERSDAVHGDSFVSTSPQILPDSQGNPQNTLTKTEVSERSEIQPLTVNSNSSEINPIKKRWLSSGKERRNVSEREEGGKRLASASEDGSSKKSVVTSGKEKVTNLTMDTSLGQSEGEHQDGERRRSLRVKTKEKEALALSLEKAKEDEGPVNERRASLRARKKDVPATNLDRESGDQKESSPHISTCPSKSEETLVSLAESKDDLVPLPLSDKGEQDVVENSSTLRKEDENSKECLKEGIGAQSQSQESDVAGEGSESSCHSDLRIEGADGRLVIKNWGKFSQKRKKKKKKKRSPLKEGYSTGSHTSNVLEEGSSFCIKEASDGPKNGIRLKITTIDRYFKPLNKSTQSEEKDQEQGSENLNGEPAQTPIKLRISKSLLSPSYKSPKRKHSKLESGSASQQPACPEETAKGTTVLTKDDKPQPMDVDVFEFDSHSSAAADEIPKTNISTPKPTLQLNCAEELNQSTASTVISPFDSPSPKASVTEKRELCYVSFSESDHSSDGEKPRRKRRRKNKEKKVPSNSDPNSISDTLQFLTSEIT